MQRTRSDSWAKVRHTGEQSPVLGKEGPQKKEETGPLRWVASLSPEHWWAAPGRAKKSVVLVCSQRPWTVREVISFRNKNVLEP